MGRERDQGIEIVVEREKERDRQSMEYSGSSETERLKCVRKKNCPGERK